MNHSLNGLSLPLCHFLRLSLRVLLLALNTTSQTHTLSILGSCLLSGSPKSWLEEKLRHSDTEAIHSFPWKNQEESHSESVFLKFTFGLQVLIYLLSSV